MNRHEQAWQHLAAAARRAPAEAREAPAPYGFATRVAAQAFGASPPSMQAMLEKFALRGLLVAGVLSLAAVGYGYTALTTEPAEAELLAGDVVAEILAQT